MFSLTPFGDDARFTNHSDELVKVKRSPHRPGQPLPLVVGPGESAIVEQVRRLSEPSKPVTEVYVLRGDEQFLVDFHGSVPYSG